jgi:hypothetical protein
MLGYESKKKPNCSIFYLFTPGDSKIGNILNIKKSKDVRSGLRGGQACRAPLAIKMQSNLSTKWKCKCVKNMIDYGMFNMLPISESSGVNR